MKKLHVSFEIHSLDTSQKFSVQGELKNNRMKFLDPDNFTHYIIFHSDLVEYYKRGETDLKLKFNLHDLTKGTYKVMGNTILFDVRTTKLEKSDGLLVVKYELFQEGQLVNNTHFKIKYNVLKEE